MPWAIKRYNASLLTPYTMLRVQFRTSNGTKIRYRVINGSVAIKYRYKRKKVVANRLYTGMLCNVLLTTSINAKFHDFLQGFLDNFFILSMIRR
jgi:hypothetical protein